MFYREWQLSGEVMTGFEYTAAIWMLHEGMQEEGLEVISNIRERNYQAILSVLHGNVELNQFLIGDKEIRDFEDTVFCGC